MLALVCYAGAFFIKSAAGYEAYALGEECTVRISETAPGIVLRCEQPVFGSCKAAAAQEGKRISCGGLIGVAETRADLGQIFRAERMRLELLRLRCDYSRRNAQVLAANAPCAAPSALDALLKLPETRASLFDIEKLSKKLDSEYTRLLESRFITAGCSGIFSAHTDGFETPDASARSAAREYARPVAGKLVTSSDWFFEADIGKKGLEPGERVRLVFEGFSVPAELVSLRDGHARFRCTEGIENALTLRHTSAEIVYEELSGYKVPDGAVVTDDGGRTYIIAAHGAGNEKIEIRLVYSGRGFCLVTTQEQGALRAGMKIITDTRDESYEHSG